MKAQLKRNTVPVQLPSPSAISVRNAMIPNQYVDPELLHQALQTLTAARTALLAACDQADMAAKRAGTPLRTQSVRLKIEELTAEVRAIESRIAQAAAGEHVNGRDIVCGVGRTLSSRKRNGLDREFDPRDRSSHFDPVRRSDRDLFDFFHRSLKDPRWYRVAAATNQTGSIDPVLLPQVTALGVSKLGKSPKSKSPMGPPVPLTTDEALAKVRELLKDGGWGSDRLMNGELKTLVKLFLSLGSATATAVIAKLTDAELKLIADDMDSSGIGNYDGLSSSEKEAFIADLATKLDAKQFARIAVAFDDPEQIAKVLAKTKGGWPAKQGFFEYGDKQFAKLPAQLRDNLVGNVWSNSAAFLLASLTAGDLVKALANLKDSPEFLQSLFLAAAGLRTGSVTANGGETGASTDTQFWFEPALLLKLNEVALQFPESAEAERFLVFQQTIEALASAKKRSTIGTDDADLKKVLLAATALFDPNPLVHLKIHSASQDTYEEWMVQLLRSGSYNLVQNLVSNASNSSAGGGLWWTGYMLGIVQRAANRIGRDKAAQADFVSNVIGGLLNALPSLAQVAGSLAVEILNKAREDVSNGQNVGDVLMHSLKTALAGESHKEDRRELGAGFVDALDSRIDTR